MNSTPILIVKRRAVFAALFSAIISVTCFIAIPAGPLGVPIVIQNMMAILTGALLGSIYGAFSVFVFLCAGALGLPVFSGGTSGIARFIGPTGGFLIGYLLGAFVCGLILGMPKVREKHGIIRTIKIIVAIIFGNITIYAAGLPWLAKVIMTNKSVSFFEALPGALAAGVIPFIPGGIIKIIISVPLAISLRPIVARYINPDT